ncbi:MAG: flippase-like domain-containing protein [Gemmatimonadetes bacterium]|nr:flippase-like domain-containing protein [Gemmatimonadota bacterium]
MSSRLRALFLLAGAAGLGWLMSRTGLGRLAEDAARTGWMLIPILAVYGLSYICYAWAWQLIMADEPTRPSFSRLYAITVSAFALDFVTPMVNVGGEPFRVAAAAPWVGVRRAVGGVVVYKMLHALALALIWLAALLLAFLLLPGQPIVIASLLLATLLVVLLILLLMTLHRRGGLERLFQGVARVPVLGRLSARLEPHRETLSMLDRQIVEFYHRDPGRFYRALAIECLGRLAYLFEYYLIFRSVEVDVDLLQIIVIGGLASLMMTATFFVPFELGTKEGSHYLLFVLLGLDPALGVYTAVVSRARDLCWIALGLSLVWFSGSRTPVKEPA